MPEEEQKQTPQEPTESASAEGQAIKMDQAQDAEILRATGARPAPAPNPDPTTQTSSPVNKSIDLTDATRSETLVVRDAAETQVEFARPQSPSPDSAGQEVSKDE